MNNLSFLRTKKLIITSAFCMLPILFTLVGSIFFEASIKEKRLQEITTEIKEEIQTLKSKRSSQKFIAQRLNQIFAQAETCQALKKKILSFLHKKNLTPSYLIWNQQGKVHSTNFSIKPNQNWKKVFDILYRFKILKINKDDSIFPEDEVLTLRKHLGPLFFHRIVNYSSKAIGADFYRTDFPKSSPILWVRLARKFGMLIKLQKSSLEKDLTFKDFVQQKNRNFLANQATYAVAYQTSTQLYSPKFLTNSLINCAQKKSAITEKPTLINSSYWSLPIKVGNSKFITLIPDRSLIFPNLKRKFFLARLFVTLLLISLVFIVHKFSNSNVNPRIGLKSQLISLFALSFMLPGLLMAYISNDYLNEYRNSRINFFHRQGMRFLQNIDSMIYEPKSHLIKKLVRPINQLKKDLEKSGPNRQTIKRFLSKLDPLPKRLFLVGSNTPTILTSHGIIRNNKLTAEFDHPNRLSKTVLLQQGTAIAKVLKVFLGELNQASLNTKLVTEAEMIISEIGKQSTTELMQEFYESLDTFLDWGFGEKRYPAYIKAFKIFAPSKYDYNLLYVSEPNLTDLNFLKRNFFHISRNKIGFKLIAMQKLSRIFPPNEKLTTGLRDYAIELKEATSSKVSFINYKGKPHIINGLKCSYLRSISLISLFPTEKIDREIARKKRQLLLFALASLLTSISFAIFLSGSILSPLQQLQLGLNAFKTKSFSYRIPNLGDDEFGNLASFYNDTLNDLEELQVAKIVQEKLIPQWEATKSCGNFNIYGKTVSLDDLGGDYFDFIEIDENHSGIILGDVAGHGTSAAIIMSFIKSCIIQMKQLYLQPNDLLTNLNKIFRKTKSKNQNKMMTFQYLLLENQHRKITFANSGHCFPIIIDNKTQTANFVELINPPLGMSKRANKGKAEIILKSGQALALYTDGFYEIGNIGFDKFKQILLDSFNKNPQKFYKNVINHYNSLTNIDESDDMSLIIIT